ncbi:hypothetical protein [Sphingopyxis macrogoltabida]|uniref:Lipoprotein n=1 Tax=Sphingopyxis macrogoltabida TaxID=33050 RepID=A0AAC9AWW6_SPHMC|nr:hypothetical protein [Sphingopyxis macrogoltabida]ALJ15061.1 hypothetical protein LH19_19495 [Sphingopyxis macrogoltabida]AMU91309.1 hypothetical protein ATM17_20045 [Sphingopyxis macrogoltabida]
MWKWFALLLCVSSACSVPVQGSGALPTKVIDPNYSIELTGDWVRDEQEDPEQHSFSSASLDTRLVSSAMGINARADQTEMIANKMAEFRLKAEGEVAAAVGRHITVTEPVVVERPWGHAIAYRGEDNLGRQFNYSGIVTTKAVISIYVESASKSETELRAILDAVVGGLTFDRTAIR